MRDGILMSIKHMPARIGSLPELMAFITDQAKKNGFSQKGVNRVCLAAEEALVNVFNHAYPADAGNVEVRVNAAGRRAFVLKIRDTGPAFNPLSLPEPDLKADISQRKVGGLGVFLIRRLADEARYKRENDSNTLTLTFSDCSEA